MHTKNVLFADLGKWNFEKQNNLLVYYAGCKKTVNEFLIDNDFSKLKCDGCFLYHKQSIIKYFRLLKYL